MEILGFFFFWELVDESSMGELDCFPEVYLSFDTSVLLP